MGVTHVVISPGSRSTPLVIAASHHFGLQLHCVVDERSAAFFALGLSRVTGKPSVLVCTSGTAGAHYFPAIIEANHAGIPLIALTADRPFELVHTGESQTIDQTRLFGTTVREFFELSGPHTDSFPQLRRRAAQAVMASTGTHPGPVHVNARFRKPLEPQGEVWVPPQTGSELSAYVSDESAPPPDAIRHVSELVRAAKRPAVVMGPSYGSRSLRGAPEKVSIQIPIFHEVTSNLVGLKHSNAIFSLQNVVKIWESIPPSAPDLVIECGMLPVSEAYRRWTVDRPHVPRVVVHPTTWVDPLGTAGLHVRCQPHELVRCLAETHSASRSHKLFLEQWVNAKPTLQGYIDGVAESYPMSEIGIAHAIFRGLPESSELMLGNSLVIRDFDLVAHRQPRGIHVVHQRGAAGIDGLVSGSAGLAMASRRPTTLALGDLSFLHDLGGLEVARRVSSPLVIVVVDNGGGRIFESLPIAQRDECRALFNEFFVAPPRVDFLTAASAFGIPAHRVHHPGQSLAALRHAYETMGCTMIVAAVDPDQSVLARGSIHSGPGATAVHDKLSRLFSNPNKGGVYV